MEEAPAIRRGVIALLLVAAATGCGDGGRGVSGDGGGAGADGARWDAGEPDADADAGPGIDGAPPDAVWPDAAEGNPWRIRFVERTEETTSTVWPGLSSADRWGVGSGALIADLDGDGDRDVFLARIDDPSSGRLGGPSLLLWNRGGAPWPRFQPDLDVAGMFAGIRAHGVAGGDVDRDGDVDVFVACEGADKLLVNQGGGVFVEQAVAAGVDGPNDDVSVAALFADLNGDGVLDLFVTNHTTVNPPLPTPAADDLLYLNRGDGAFDDVSALAGVDDDGAGHVSVAADLGGTGALDLVIANDRFAVDGVSGRPDDYPPDAWYVRTSLDDQGVPRFGDVATTRGIVALRSTMGIAVHDVDGDLTPDLYVTDWGDKELYLNPTPGGAVVSAAADYDLGERLHLGTVTVQVSWGTRFLDLDRDGFDEVALVNGTVSEALTCEARKQVDVYLRQASAGGRFDDITATVGWPPGPLCGAAATGPNAGRGLFVGDLDGDGDDDLMVAGYGEPARTFENATPHVFHAVRARLVGTVSAVDPIGARLILTRTGGARVARFRVAGGDTNGQSDGVLEVGLGAATTFEAAAITWPSGLVQDVGARLAADTTVTITEPRWMTLEPRVLTGAASASFEYRPVDARGAFLGVAGAGRTVTVTRSDGVPVVVVPSADGRYAATITAPAAARAVVLTVTVDGVTLPPRPRVVFR